MFTFAFSSFQYYHKGISSGFEIRGCNVKQNDTFHLFHLENCVRRIFGLCSFIGESDRNQCRFQCADRKHCKNLRSARLYRNVVIIDHVAKTKTKFKFYVHIAWTDKMVGHKPACKVLNLIKKLKQDGEWTRRQYHSPEYSLPVFIRKMDEALKKMKR